MRVVAIAGDAGGARALLPVIAELRSRGVAIDARAYAAATAIWTAAGLRPGPVHPIDLGGADRVLLGTTVGPEQYEQEYVAASQTARIPAVSVVDSWVHYRERFTSLAGEVRWPDHVAVADDEMRAGIVGQGAPPSRVVVTGQPTFDELAPLATPAGRRAARVRVCAAFGIPTGGTLVLFASQPLHQLYSTEQLGFDDRAIVAEVVTDLVEVVVARGGSADLVVKLHPREMADPPPVPLSPGSAVRVHVASDDRLSARELAAAADLVVGMSSILLIEACLVGTPAISYQPGLRLPDPLPANRWGWTRSVDNRGELAVALDAELYDEAARDARRTALVGARVDGGAARRVAEIVMAH